MYQPKSTISATDALTKWHQDPDIDLHLGLRMNGGDESNCESEGLSTAQWLGELAEGDQEAAARLWAEYYEQLVVLARKKLSAANRRVADEEDLALSVIENLCRGAAKNQFPDLEDRDDLWRLLFTIMDRKAKRFVAKERRQKRGGGLVRGDSVVDDGKDSRAIGLDQFAVARDPTPDEAMELAENVRLLLDQLPDDSLREVAAVKMEGQTNQQIAERLGCSERTIKRRLQMIRTVWVASYSEVEQKRNRGKTS